MNAMELALYFLGGGAAIGLVWNTWNVGNGMFEDYRKEYVAETEATLALVFSSVPPERIFQLSMLAAGIVFVLFSLAINLIAGVLFAIAAFFAPRMIFNIMRDKRRLAFDLQLVDGLGLLANSLKAGLTLPQSMELLVQEMKPPITQEFGRVLQEYRLGNDFDQAFLNAAHRIGSRDLDVLVNAIMITRRTGGNMGEIFGTIAQGIRERIRIEGKVRALAATANMQALVMSAMPFALVVALYFLEPLHVKLLFSTTIGLAAMGVVCVLSVVAFIWIKKIMDLDV
jgi:tight adherence protein B